MTVYTYLLSIDGTAGIARILVNVQDESGNGIKEVVVMDSEGTILETRSFDGDCPLRDDFEVAVEVNKVPLSFYGSDCRHAPFEETEVEPEGWGEGGIVFPSDDPCATGSPEMISVRLGEDPLSVFTNCPAALERLREAREAIQNLCEQRASLRSEQRGVQRDIMLLASGIALIIFLMIASWVMALLLAVFLIAAARSLIQNIARSQRLGRELRELRESLVEAREQFNAALEQAERNCCDFVPEELSVMPDCLP